MTAIWCDTALLPTGWARRVRIGIAGTRISTVEGDCPAVPSDTHCAVALPGLANLHSHAFQRGMAGQAEAPGGHHHDDFWSWREAMYRLVDRLTPDDVAAIAAMAFVEMLEAGFTRVGEFHYLHHEGYGRAYGAVATMAAAIASASAEAGIGLTLLPVFYAHAGFGDLPPTFAQRRFITDLDGFARLHAASATAIAALDGAILGIAPHSLRAVSPAELSQLLALAPQGPIHIHIAEQQAEVAACIAWSGRRPVEWLLSEAPVDDRWCLVHATHVEPPEWAGIIAAGAVVGLCPITEANLGDGVFPAAAFMAGGGRIGIGSDSNVRIDAAEEFRTLEYGQRLSLRRRNVLAFDGGSTGRTLFERAYRGGAQALGVKAAGISVGAAADIVALAPGDAAIHDDETIDHWIFARGRVDAVWRSGRQLVRDGRHVGRDAMEGLFYRALSRIRAS